jgi:hypothetical protein
MDDFGHNGGPGCPFGQHEQLVHDVAETNSMVRDLHKFWFGDDTKLNSGGARDILAAHARILAGTQRALAYLSAALLVVLGAVVTGWVRG